MATIASVYLFHALSTASTTLPSPPSTFSSFSCTCSFSDGNRRKSNTSDLFNLFETSNPTGDHGCPENLTKELLVISGRPTAVYVCINHRVGVFVIRSTHPQPLANHKCPSPLQSEEGRASCISQQSAKSIQLERNRERCVQVGSREYDMFFNRKPTREGQNIPCGSDGVLFTKLL